MQIIYFNEKYEFFFSKMIKIKIFSPAGGKRENPELKLDFPPLPWYGCPFTSRTFTRVTLVKSAIRTYGQLP